MEQFLIECRKYSVITLFFAPLSRPIGFKLKPAATYHSRFLALQAVCLPCFDFELSLAPDDIFLATICCCDCFDFDFTTLDRKALKKSE